MPDLPDYEKKIIIVTEAGEYPALIQVDLRKILGVDLVTPTIAACVPTSIENPAIAYDLANNRFKTYIENEALAYDLTNDRFKVDIEAMSVGVIDTTTDLTKVLGAALSKTNPVLARLTDGTNFIDPRDRNWTISESLATTTDLTKVLGAALSKTNPVLARLTDGTNFIDPRDRNWTISESLARSWVLGSSDIPDLLDRNTRLLGIVYGSVDKLQQRATTKELIVQIQHQGTEKDPTQIRALTSGDTVTVVQGTAASLKATVTQAEKDRTISSVDATATPVQISNTYSASGNYTVKTPASGKKIRLKFISLELSADIDLGYRFAAAGTIYYLRTTKGPYVSNLMGCNVEGAANEALILNASGACTVKGYALISEV
jgi:hypothetical protein